MKYTKEEVLQFVAEEDVQFFHILMIAKNI